ncbi:MAG: cell wall-binding repeat-containing protein [Anaerosomatales bacterium]|nr:cell wall-binding repeat-containing protein [Anaerosomatales bacterium]
MRRATALLIASLLVAGLVPIVPAPAHAAIPAADLFSVFFIDQTTGFAAGANGLIAKTTNGGENWWAVRTGAEALRGVAFWTSLQGVAVSLDRKALGTTDGGSTWTLLNNDFTQYSAYNELINVNRLAVPPGPTDRLGFAVGGYNVAGGIPYVPEQVWRTLGNGGAYWGNQPVLRPCRYPDPDGETGGDPVGKGEFFGIDFVDAVRGWVVGVDYFPTVATATVYATTDGGGKWMQQSVGAPVSLRDVSFATTATGVAVSAQGRVFYTRNGGTTWSEGVSPVTTALNAVVLTDASTGWAVGAGGKILKTTNGGQTWTQVSSPTVNDLYDVTAVGSKAWAVGRYGTILLCLDGATWRAPQPDVTPPAITSLSSSTHPDPAVWYASGAPQFAWAASDAGGVAGYSYAFDQSPATVPDTQVDTTASSASFMGLASGEWYFHLRAVDAAGNWSGASHLKVRVDVTPPSTASDARSLYPGPATITLGPSDAHSGVALTRWVLDGAPGTGTTVTASGDGLHTLSYASVDAAGNVEATQTVEFVIDTVLPTVDAIASSTHPDAAAWYRSVDASFTWTASSSVGIAGYSYELSADPACVPDEVVDTVAPQASASVPADGVRYFCVRAKDTLDRWGATQRRAVRVDRVPPATTDDASAVCTAAASIVTLNPSDAHSGVALTRWVLDGVPGVGTSVFVQGDGLHALAYASVDRAGNVEATRTVQILVDSTPPAIVQLVSPSHPDENRWYRNGDVSLAWSAADANGVAGYSWTFDAAPGTVPAAQVSTTAASASFVGLSTGEHWFHLRAVDAYGTWSATAHRRVRVDVDAPVTAASVSPSYEASAAIELLPADVGSGVASTWWSLDSDPPRLGTGIGVDALGAHTLRFGSVDAVGNAEATRTVAFEVVRPAGSVPTSVSVAGSNRILTAIEAARRGFPTGAKTVVIATGWSWPDALGGAALAGVADAPILLTYVDRLPDEVAAEIRRLGASKVYVLGGTGAVSSNVQTQLASIVGTSAVERLGGVNRYETARKIAAKVVALQGASYDGTAFLATGANFPDALGASPIAAAKGWPIFLVDPRAGADAALIEALRAAKVKRAVVLGGTGAVSDDVKNVVGRAVGCTTDRWAGLDRYSTAATVAAKGVAAGLSWNRCGLATGENFPDALAAGPCQGQAGSAMLLTKSTLLPDAPLAALASNKRFIAEIRFFGGTGVLTSTVRNAAFAAIE